MDDLTNHEVSSTVETVERIKMEIRQASRNGSRLEIPELLDRLPEQSESTVRRRVKDLVALHGSLINYHMGEDEGLFFYDTPADPDLSKNGCGCLLCKLKSECDQTHS